MTTELETTAVECEVELEMVECCRCHTEADEYEIVDGLCDDCYRDEAEYDRAMEDKYDGMKAGDFD